MSEQTQAKTNYPPVSVEKLKELVKRIESHEEEKHVVAGVIKDIYVEAKAAGFDTRVLHKLIALRRKDAEEVEEADMLLHTYQRALE